MHVLPQWLLQERLGAVQDCGRDVVLQQMRNDLCELDALFTESDAGFYRAVSVYKFPDMGFSPGADTTFWGVTFFLSNWFAAKFFSTRLRLFAEERLLQVTSVCIKSSANRL